MSNHRFNPCAFPSFVEKEVAEVFFGIKKKPVSYLNKEDKEKCDATMSFIEKAIAEGILVERDGEE